MVTITQSFLHCQEVEESPETTWKTSELWFASLTSYPEWILWQPGIWKLEKKGIGVSRLQGKGKTQWKGRNRYVPGFQLRCLAGTLHCNFRNDEWTFQCIIQLFVVWDGGTLGAMPPLLAIPYKSKLNWEKYTLKWIWTIAFPLLYSNPLWTLASSYKCYLISYTEIRHSLPCCQFHHKYLYSINNQFSKLFRNSKALFSLNLVSKVATDFSLIPFKIEQCSYHREYVDQTYICLMRFKMHVSNKFWSFKNQQELEYMAINYHLMS